MPRRQAIAHPFSRSVGTAAMMDDDRGDVEDDVDAATPVDAQNAPTGVWKSRKQREIPTAPTSIIVIVRKRKRTKSKTTYINCPPNRITPSSTAEVYQVLT